MEEFNDIRKGYSSWENLYVDNDGNYHVEENVFRILYICVIPYRWIRLYCVDMEHVS